MLESKRLLLLIALGWLSVSNNASPTPCTSPTVVVRNGTLQGLLLENYSQEAFLGIPFALPPVGNLRLRPPQSLNSTFDFLKVTEYSPFCPGFGSDDDGYTLDGDCLTLNVVRPKGIVAGSNIPIGLWIHGGSFSEGGSGDVRYNGTWVVQRSVAMKKPIIFVSVNYRLFTAGFLYSKEIAVEGATNLGLRDQRLAMEWVHENIRAFGGDPERVTIWGESAGAMAISNHLLSSNSTSFFRAAILESGGATTVNYPTIVDSQPNYDALVQAVGCEGSSDTVGCLRALPFELWNSVANDLYKNGIEWLPVVDGDIVPRLPTAQLAEQDFIHVPLLIGANSDEGTAFATFGIDNDTALRQALVSRYDLLTENSIDTILSLYPDDPSVGAPYGTGDGVLSTGLQDKRSCSIFGDTDMIAPRRLLARAAAVQSSVFSYRFNQVTQNMSMDIGVTHFQEIPYVFSNPLPTTSPLGNRPSDRALAKLMTSHWISFIHDLDPNYTELNSTAYWPKYASEASNMVFERQGSYVEPDNFREEGIAFINQLGPEMKH
ncbi:hypothetical protein P7C70_g4959, partial [Phenoliferia sp. Uapishka_3]